MLNDIVRCQCDCHVWLFVWRLLARRPAWTKAENTECYYEHESRRSLDYGNTYLFLYLLQKFWNLQANTLIACCIHLTLCSLACWKLCCYPIVQIYSVLAFFTVKILFTFSQDFSLLKVTMKSKFIFFFGLVLYFLRIIYLCTSLFVKFTSS